MLSDPEFKSLLELEPKFKSLVESDPDIFGLEGEECK